MAVQFSVAVRNGMLNAIEATIGASPFLYIFTGPMPAACSAASTGTMIAEFDLPADWMAAASSGVKSKTGTWTLASIGDGDAGYYRIMDGGAFVSTCYEQGKVGMTMDDNVDMTIDNTNINSSYSVTITSFSKTEGGA